MRAGPLSVLVALILLPLQAFFDLLYISPARQQRLGLSPYELVLRRATQPFGVLAVVLWFAFTREGLILRYAAASSLQPNPVVQFWLGLAAIAFPGVLAVSCVIGLRQAVRARGGDSGQRLVAGLKLAAGAAGLYLLGHNVYLVPDNRQVGQFLLWSALDLVALWWLVVNAARLVLLLLPAPSAEDQVAEHIADTEFQWDP